MNHTSYTCVPHASTRPQKIEIFNISQTKIAAHTQDYAMSEKSRNYEFWQIFEAPIGGI